MLRSIKNPLNIAIHKTTFSEIGNFSWDITSGHISSQFHFFIFMEEFWFSAAEIKSKIK